MTVLLIGIDDTDNQSSPGTGRLARSLCDECARRGLRPLGVTRHQFLIDPAIPYTSHNSGACIAVESASGLENPDFIYEFVARNCADGSDPGVCIAVAAEHAVHAVRACARRRPERSEGPTVPQSIVEFANLGTQRVVTMPDAFNLAKQAAIALRGLGGTCQGVIGALGSVGLRASGNNGRFIDLPGLRELHGCVDAAAFDKIGVAVEHCSSERAPDANDRYETLDWVRPRLIGGRAVLPVQWSQQKNAWIPLDRKEDLADGHHPRS